MQRTFLYILFLFFSVAGFSQKIKINDTADGESSYSPQELIENVLIMGTCSRVANFNSQVEGAPTDINTKSYGYFKRPTGSNFPFEEGIVLSSGKAVEGGGSIDPMSASTTLGGDSDLSSVFPGVPFTDATFIEFDFTPYISSISFRFLMASEEYQSDFPCIYSDGFAFMLTDLTTGDKTNIALVPGTSDPVSSKTIRDSSFGCGAKNETYFAGRPNDTNFSGRTEIMTISANVIANRTYRIKLVVADAGDVIADSGWDSAIFLEGGSFNLGDGLATTSDNIPKLAACDNSSVGDNYDGFNLFDLETNKSIILNGQPSADYTLTYFEDDAYTIAIPNSEINSYQNVTSLQTIYVQMTNNSDPLCFDRTSFEIEVYEVPEINSPILFRQCDDDSDHITLMDLTLANTYVSDNSNNEIFIYFENQIDAENRNMAQRITNPTNYVSGNAPIWVRVENEHCYVVGKINIEVSVSNTTYDTTLTVCDDSDDAQNNYDGISQFDLTQVANDVLSLFSVADRSDLIMTFYPSPIDNAQLQINRIENPSKYRSSNDRIFIRIDNKNNLDCAGMGLDLYIDLVVNETPFFEIKEKDKLLYCTDWQGGKNPVRVIGYPKNYKYVWKDEFENTLEIDPIDDELAYFTHAGTYTVTATDPDTNCAKTKTFTVKKSSLPRIKTFTIKDNSLNNQIAILVEGEGVYEYALDNEAFVDGNEINGHIFYNVEEGLHVVHINDVNGCSPVLDKEVVIIRFSNYISPNHDGINDKFLVHGGEGFVLSLVTIFDRHGRVVAILNQNEAWDGTYLGKVALEADYWFVAKFIDKEGKNYERRGNFSLTK